MAGDIPTQSIYFYYSFNKLTHMPGTVWGISDRVLSNTEEIVP